MENVDRYRLDVQAYFSNKFKMSEKVAENFASAYLNRSLERKRARGWTISHPQFVKLAKWWAKRYK